MSATTLGRTAVEGTVHRGFEAVHEAFTDNFVRRHELGGACCAYCRGEKVVDLWGGIRNRMTGDPWERNTMVIVLRQRIATGSSVLRPTSSRSVREFSLRLRL